MKKLEVIRQFLQEKARPELAEMFSEEHELQVNVGQDSGTKISGTTKTGYNWWGYTDGNETWKHIRIPWGADSVPSYTDSTLTFSTKRFEAIGFTGWNWVKKQSEWVGFDFDSIINHTQGLSDAELTAIRHNVEEVPWITVRRSTSGKGLHLYVVLDPPIPTTTHTEHAALARAILGILSARIGNRLDTSVDTCGGVLWVWHRRMSEDAYVLIGEQGKALTEVPSNWRDHVEVISKKRTRCKPPVQATEEEILDELVNRTKAAPLDDEHRRLLGWLGSNQAMWWWDNDRGVLVCHTYDLQRAHRELKLKGPFYTISEGKDTGKDQNCFGFPLRNGAWVFRRHTRRTAEHPCWTIDSGGWTRCYYNTLSDLATALRCQGGVERADGWFEITTLRNAMVALADLGASATKIDEYLMGRPAQIRLHKDGRAVIKIQRTSSEPVPEGWASGRGGDTWERLINIQNEEPEIEVPDHFLRHLVADGTDAGWYIYTRNTWTIEGESNIRKAMIANGYSSKESTRIMGHCVLQPWHLVARPFQPEYPGNRLWNRRAPQFSVRPTEGQYPTWTTILKHCGTGIDIAVSRSSWCNEHGVKNGADYLFLWVASMFQFPYEPLPYLFFYSADQNTGKSSFHESLSLLFRDKIGYVEGEVALRNNSRFNAELINAVLCFVEEVNLQKSPEAYSRIKNWVTGRTILIHEKGKTPFEMPNCTHWVQCDNEVDACPVFPGDTRIVLCHVPGLPVKIPKGELTRKLEVEAPAFLYDLLHKEIPPTNERLRIPVITSAEKLDQEHVNSGPVREFFRTKIHFRPGQAILCSDVFEVFMSLLPPEQRKFWNYRRFSKEVPEGYDRGKYRGNVYHFINVSMDAEAPTGPALIKIYDRVVEPE